MLGARGEQLGKARALRKSTYTSILALLDKIRVALKQLSVGVSRLGRTRGHSDPFPIPVLCYHSWTINGPSYNENDHVALSKDLNILARRGYQILPVPTLVSLIRGDIAAEQLAGKKLVCITFDDGRDEDFHDHYSSEHGEVPSFYSLLKSAVPWLPQYPQGPRAISFVIASPDARAVLDRTCGYGKGGWRDSWWRESAAEGLLGIANHSWDHVHDTLDSVRQCDNIKGSFFEIKTIEDAEAQILEAQAYIQSKTDSKSLPYFCYPYGHVSTYLRDSYFPSHGDRIGIVAAFSTAGETVTEDSSIWALPRFVCGEHWKSPYQFSKLLTAIETGKR
jgi:peptidoglycan/xylan/chitin deacetylase (PgdA/CDA1 family)